MVQRALCTPTSLDVMTRTSSRCEREREIDTHTQTHSWDGADLSIVLEDVITVRARSLSVILSLGLSLPPSLSLSPSPFLSPSLCLSLPAYQLKFKMSPDELCFVKCENGYLTARSLVFSESARVGVCVR